LKNKKVIISKDRIFYSDGNKNKGIVMDKIAKPITEEFCSIVGKSRGDILDIGFGLGYSADRFYSMGVKSYTCIEINKQIYDTAIKWAEDKDNVNIIYGDWIDIIPTLNKKFDGIFMDTYEDKNYSKFEDYAKLISNENCCLSIYEYPELKSLNLLNSKAIKLEQEGYELLLKPYHRVCWTYFVANKFRKNKFFSSKKLLSKKLCNKLISDNKDSLIKEEVEKEVDGILHKRIYKFTNLKYNKAFEDILNNTFFLNYQKVNLKDILCVMVEYGVGEGYDRHVETIKGLSLDHKEQYNMIYDFTLNDDYEGGEVEIYDAWHKNDRDTFSAIKPNIGECLIYKPYQHATYKKVTKNKKYQIIVMIKNKDLKKTLI
tara:strand:- start:19639 stop:20757 length:1119 start_codon:yes stop_codon:yes gene_type:complete